jgi:hypothetical protein
MVRPLTTFGRNAVPPTRPIAPDDFSPEESPIAWFGEMLLAIDRGDFQKAAWAQRQLERLGWRVRKTRRDPETTAGKGVQDEV